MKRIKDENEGAPQTPDFHEIEEIEPSAAAKRLSALDKETPADSGSEAPSAAVFSSRLENFWYHYKWVVIIAAFFIVIAAIAIIQLASNDKADANILYAGPSYVSSDANRAVCAAVEAVMTDTNGDGKKTALLTDISYSTEEQIAEYKKTASEVGDTFFFDYASNNAAYEKFTKEIFADEHGLCFLDPALYAAVRDEGGFISLEEIFGYIPDNAYDGYGIALGKTDLYTRFEGVDSLPPDTVIACRAPSSFSIFKSKKSVEESKRAYMALMIAVSAA